MKAHIFDNLRLKESTVIRGMALYLIGPEKSEKAFILVPLGQVLCGGSSDPSPQSSRTSQTLS